MPVPLRHLRHLARGEPSGRLADSRQLVEFSTSQGNFRRRRQWSGHVLTKESSPFPASTDQSWARDLLDPFA